MAASLLLVFQRPAEQETVRALSLASGFASSKTFSLFSNFKKMINGL